MRESSSFDHLESVSSIIGRSCVVASGASASAAHKRDLLFLAVECIVYVPPYSTHIITTMSRPRTRTGRVIGRTPTQIGACRKSCRLHRPKRVRVWRNLHDQVGLIQTDASWREIRCPPSDQDVDADRVRWCHDIPTVQMLDFRLGIDISSSFSSYTFITGRILRKVRSWTS